MPLQSAIVYWHDPATGERGRLSTSVSGQANYESVRAYYMQLGGQLNIGHADQDRIVQVERVELIPPTDPEATQ